MTRFSFWGLFAAYFALLLAYALWMRRAERREERRRSRPPA